jgi:hypothetical protein
MPLELPVGPVWVTTVPLAYGYGVKVGMSVPAAVSGAPAAASKSVTGPQTVRAQWGSVTDLLQ